MNNKNFWKRRLKNKTFWVSLCSSLFLLIQLLDVDVTFLPQNLEGIVNVLLTIFTLLGILNDPTNTSGLFIDTADLDGDGIPDVYEDMIEAQEENNDDNDMTPKG